MASSTLRSSAPLTVASAAALIGGAGNVAFSLHAGSQLALALLRFLFGLAVLSVALHLAGRRRSRSGLPARSSGGVLARHLVAAFYAAAVVLSMAAAASVPTVVLTLLAMLSPALLALAGRIFGLPRASRVQTAAAAVAVVSAALVPVWSGLSWQAQAPGVAAVTVATLLGVASSVLVARLGPDVSPTRLMRSTCAWGVALCLLLALADVQLRFTVSTAAAALFIAVGPGGVAAVMVLWATARTAPHLVAAAGALALLTATAGDVLLLGYRPPAPLLVSVAVCVAAVAVMRHPLSARRSS